MADVSDWRDPIFGARRPPARAPVSPRIWFSLAAVVAGLCGAMFFRSAAPPTPSAAVAPVVQLKAVPAASDELQPLPVKRSKRKDLLEERQ